MKRARRRIAARMARLQDPSMLPLLYNDNCWKVTILVEVAHDV
jgi:hypothetical protein